MAVVVGPLRKALAWPYCLAKHITALVGLSRICGVVKYGPLRVAKFDIVARVDFPDGVSMSLDPQPLDQ
jgi:hypothetical protein